MHKIFAFGLLLLFSLHFNADAARTAIKSQDVAGGTKISESGTNSFVDAECSDSYFGCMDAFCIVDNISGGRCQCSNKHAELSKKLDDLMAKDEQAANIAEYGADIVKMGKATDTVLNDVKNATQKKSNDKDGKKTLSRADWDAMFMTSNDDNDDDEEFVDADDISNKHGDALYVAADEMCMEQTPSKCKSTSEMLQMMYVQKIKSDCLAFENSLKQQGNEINAKLADAQKTVRDAALTEMQNANKYGLGGCVKEFRTCMQTTAGCGDDFVGCVALSGNENVKQNSSKFVIVGDTADVEISGTTIDNLLSKKVLCESVLNNCEKVKDDVWDAFLKDVASTLKIAELNSEDNLRKNCIVSVSDCFVKSCREHFDVNQEEGSYDMCLARPENYKSFCKVELEPCLAATGGSYDNPEQSRLWTGIMSKLSAMRVDACTNEFKSCIQDKDRCGDDFSQCIGLDYYDIVDLCPTDKLTACYREYKNEKETVEDTLAQLAQGLMLGVESALYDACQNAINEAMVKYCGSEEDCSDLITKGGIGDKSLEIQYCENVDDKYTNCKNSVKDILDTELGKKVRNADLSISSKEEHYYSGVITGKIMWDQITNLPDNSGVISGDEYIKKVQDIYYMDDKVKEKVKTEIGGLANAIKNAIAVVESDPRVQFCTTGRQVEGLTKDNGFQQIIGKANNQLFPNLTQNIRGLIIDSALLAAQENYNKKYDEMLKDYVENNAVLKQRYAEIKDANYHLDVQDSARQKCIELGEWGAITSAKSGQSAKTEIVREKGNDGKLVGYSSESTYKLKRQVTTNFSYDTMTCTKCTRTQECETKKSDYCKKWKEEVETCEEIKY